MILLICIATLAARARTVPSKVVTAMFAADWSNVQKFLAVDSDWLKLLGLSAGVCRQAEP